MAAWICAVLLICGWSHSASAQNLEAALADKNSCWRSYLGLVLTGGELRAQMRGLQRGGANQVSFTGSRIEVWRYSGAPSNFDVTRVETWRRVPCQSSLSFEDFITLYFGGSVGLAGATTPFQVTATGSAGIFDPTPPNSNNVSSSGFVGGVFVGALVPVGTVPFVQNLLPGNTKVGAEVGIDFFGGNSATIQGVPGGPFGTVTGRDSIDIRDNRLFTASGVIDFPISSNVNAFVKGGFALVNKTVSYNCVTFCNVLPATPQFSESKDVNLSGAVVGVGVQMPLPMGWLPGARIGVEFDHVFVSNTDVTLGTLPTRLVGANLSQDINKLAARMTLPLSDIRLKRDIVRVARLDNGMDLYRYRYLWSDQLYVGVMAQEVAAITPDAVMRGADGYLRVDYARLGLRMQTWEEWLALH
jgi:hypothetical protein